MFAGHRQTQVCDIVCGRWCVQVLGLQQRPHSVLSLEIQEKGKTELRWDWRGGHLQNQQDFVFYVSSQYSLLIRSRVKFIDKTPISFIDLLGDRHPSPSEHMMFCYILCFYLDLSLTLLVYLWFNSILYFWELLVFVFKCKRLVLTFGYYLESCWTRDLFTAFTQSLPSGSQCGSWKVCERSSGCTHGQKEGSCDSGDVVSESPGFWLEFTSSVFSPHAYVQWTRIYYKRKREMSSLEVEIIYQHKLEK